MNLLTDPEEFQAWKEHRLTAAFLQFLKDRQLALAMAWAEGSRLTPEDQGKSMELGELSRLSADDVREFYSKAEEAE